VPFLTEEKKSLLENFLADVAAEKAKGKRSVAFDPDE
jgi:hypothetical protein